MNARLIRALYWLLSGLRAIHQGIDEQIIEAMDNLWTLADEERDND